MTLLRQNTAVTILLGPYVSSDDGDTRLNALSIGPSAVLLSKNGGALGAKHDEGFVVSGSEGFYTVALDATDTDTLRHLKIVSNVAGALAVWADCMVITQSAYDALVDPDAGYAMADDLQTIAEDIGPGDGSVKTMLGDLTDSVTGPLGTNAKIAEAAGAITTLDSTVTVGLQGIGEQIVQLPTGAEVSALTAAVGDTNEILAGVLGDGAVLQPFISRVGGVPTAGVVVRCYKDAGVTVPHGGAQISGTDGATFWLLNAATDYWYVQQLDGVTFAVETERLT